LSEFFTVDPVNQKFRHYVFTVNNWTNEQRAIIDGLECEYVCYQPERGHGAGGPGDNPVDEGRERGTRHLQGFISFKNPRSFGGVSRLCRGWHIERMRGTIEQCVSYCSKQDTRDTEAGFEFIERGTRPMGAGTAGKRCDLDDVGSLIKSGGRPRDVFESDAGAFIRYNRGILAAVALFEPKRDFVTDVYWFYGPTGSGKSRAALLEAPDAYWKDPSSSWWDGYDRHADVIIDDYRADFCKFSQLLRLFDRYPLQIQFKGGTCQFVAKRIFVTCPKGPRDVWSGRTEEDISQLMRRIKEVKHFPFRLVAAVVAVNDEGMIPA